MVHGDELMAQSEGGASPNVVMKLLGLVIDGEWCQPEVSVLVFFLFVCAAASGYDPDSRPTRDPPKYTIISIK